MGVDGWKRYREWLIDCSELGFRLDLSRTGLTQEWLETMQPRVDRAFDAMESLESGGIANPDENRMVGHYWLRDSSRAPTQEIRGQIDATLDEILEFAGRVHDGDIRPTRTERFRHLLVIGIGGSALGPQFVAQSLGRGQDRMQPHFLDNTDPEGIDGVLGRIGDELESTLVVVISKSGGTPETRNGMLETKAAFKAAGLELGPHAVAITQEGSKLDTFSKQNGFLERFPMWDWVGGRTSLLCAVGLLPAALQGIDVRGMLDGARQMDVVTRGRVLRENPAAMLALAWFHAGDGRGAKDMVILPYKDRLALFSRYLQQLVMESLGKEKDLDGKVVHQGIAVYGNKGSTDQHAYVQQLREGVPNFFATFIEVLEDREGKAIEVEPGVTSGDFLQGFLLGTRQALHDNGRDSVTITVRQVGPFCVGLLIALYERAVGLYATMVNVNAYHQPGVEAGKKAAASVLALQLQLVELMRRRKGSATAEELASELGSPEQTETVFKLLERLAENSERGVVRETGSSVFEARYSLSG